jgi:hypothetical protein
MSNSKLTGLGEITSNFLLNDFDVFLMNTSATGGYVATDWALMGFTSAEKSIERNNEKFTREAKIPRVPVYKKTIRKGMKIKFSLDNINPDVISQFTQGTQLTTGTCTQISHGTDEPRVQYRAIRLASTREDGTIYTITIPKCEMSQDGEQSFGGEENTRIPLVLEAIYNPNANGTGSLYYEQFIPFGTGAGYSATADVPPGF